MHKTLDGGGESDNRTCAVLPASSSIIDFSNSCANCDCSELWLDIAESIHVDSVVGCFPGGGCNACWIVLVG